MAKRIFGSIDSFVETSETSLKLGRLVANFGFLRALLTYGDFDQFQIYCPTLENLRLLQTRLEATVDDRLLERVVLSHHFRLVEALGQTDFAAFHLSDWYWYLPKMARLRAAHSPYRFPLSAPIHSLGGADMPGKVRELADAPLEAGDSVFCTSTTGLTAFANYLDRAAGARRPRLDLMPLGVAEEYFEQRDRAAARERLDLRPDSFCLLYVGRLSVATKADLIPTLYLLERLRREAGVVAGRTVDWKLLIAGGGTPSDLDNLRLASEELGLAADVLLRPNVGDDEKLDLLATADVFISPVDNFQETFGISIIEAMAAGLPVVASDFDGYRDLVREGETGFRIPTLWGKPPEAIFDTFELLEANLSALAFAQGIALDQEVFFQRLRQLAGDAALRRRLGEAGRQVARREYAWQAVIARCDALWRELKAEAAGAAATSRRPPAKGGRCSFTEVFHNYPSAHLDPDTQVAATPLAHAVLAGRLPLPASYADISLLSSGELVAAILQAVGDHASTIRNIAKSVTASLGIPADYTAYRIGWLLKYGLLRVLKEYPVNNGHLEKPLP